MKGTVHYETRGNIALMTVDNPPVNPLSSGVRQGLYDGVEKALADDAVAAIVLTGAGRAFIAGADIKEMRPKTRGSTSTGTSSRSRTRSRTAIALAIEKAISWTGVAPASCR